MPEPKPRTSAVERAREVIRIEAAAVRDVAARLDGAFDEAVEILSRTTGKVVVTGLGKSGIICRKIAATLASTGTPAFFLHAAEAGHGDLGTVFRGDSVLAVSNSGETAEILGILPVFKRLDLPIIAMTGAAGSSLGKAADVTLDVGVAEEACPLALAPTSSTTATLAMGDALAVVLMERRGFAERDFAVLHPAGNLGRKLLAVADLMHRGETLPIVRESDSLAAALAEMTAKRLGHTTVVDADGRLVGILSDGDLRRILQRPALALDRPVRDVMTRAPKTIRADALAAEAVAVMERHTITALVVAGDDGRPEALVHLHDCLRAGVV